MKQNPHILKSFVQSLNRIVVRIKFDDNGNETERTEYESRSDAAEANSISASNIGKAVAYQQMYRGYQWTDVEHEDLPGEYWASFRQKNWRKYQVSNLGRICGPNKRKTYGSKAGASYKFGMPGRKTPYAVHELLAFAFLGARPTPQHTVDHIDGDPFNNLLENLRWYSKTEQARNRKSVKAVEAFYKGTIETIGTWMTIVDAAEATGAHAAHITSVIKGKRRSAGTRDGKKIAWRHKDVVVESQDSSKG